MSIYRTLPQRLCEPHFAASDSRGAIAVITATGPLGSAPPFEDAKNAISFDHLVSDPNSYAAQLIRFKARQLSMQPGFRRDERDLLEHRLRDGLLRQIGNFNPARACFNTFAAMVTNTGAGILVRERRRKKRVWDDRTQSLDADARKPGRVERRSASISDADGDRRRGKVSRNATAEWVDAEAFQLAWDAIPEKIRNVLRLVMGGSISSAARQLGVSRRQVRKVLKRAKPYLVSVGFGPS